jgi:hypothetical protein
MKSMQEQVLINRCQPNLFAVIDLSAGDHQAAMSLAARGYTAFILYTCRYQFK